MPLLSRMATESSTCLRSGNDVVSAGSWRPICQTLSKLAILGPRYLLVVPSASTLRGRGTDDEAGGEGEADII